MHASITDAQKKKDFQMMLATSTHLGTKNLDFQMTRYVWKRKPDGIHIINLGRTYDKLLPAEENTDVYERQLKDLGVECQYVRNVDPNEEHGCCLKDSEGIASTNKIRHP